MALNSLCFYQDCTISLLNSKLLKSVDQFIYLHLSAGAVEYIDCVSAEGKIPLTSFLEMTKQSDGECSNNAGALGNVEYPFIAITPKSTLTRSNSS